MARNFFDNITRSVRNALRTSDTNEDILIDAIKLDDYLAGQRKKIKRFSGDLQKDLDKVNNTIERNFIRSLEKTLSNSSRSASNQIINASRTGVFSFADVGSSLTDGLTDVAVNAAGSALENGINLAVSQALTHTSTRSYETQRSQDISADFGKNATQQSAEANRVISSGNRNL